MFEQGIPSAGLWRPPMVSEQPTIYAYTPEAAAAAVADPLPTIVAAGALIAAVIAFFVLTR